ncbi:NAD(P)H-hydrate dehydratase [Mobilitalea sibirica]|uniref:Bifunctional NAD(P)H-hydrate repair enzyme n=1 Tax=Mobilitalea sibirica TaxID=1462919 RepID=A0A8J7H509_9FIRM|nr:NAD(P)H-hydrate dehydratase [Mobilitalea sibirica]MBH1942227.1 NAD(P)H-hydrate dehydratase [Mobilitalea sibirica]
MKFALNSKSTKHMDDITVNEIKIPALVLMERAALQTVERIKERIDKSSRILAVCGPGNNGGDGIAAGRILYLQGYHVAILLLFDEEKATEQTKVQIEIAKNLGITFENSNKLHEYNIIIDAILGVGLSRPVTGIYENIIQEINQTKNLVFSVDIPSGISADTGAVLNMAVRADETITFGVQKLGLLLYPGAEYAGRITVADIGFPEAAIQQTEPDAFYYEAEDLAKLPIRCNYSHKGTYGKVLVIAGSKGVSGAAFLSAKAAYRMGAGLVKVLTCADNREIIQTLLPEALFEAYDRNDMQKSEQNREILKALRWASVIVIGPGLGQSEKANELLSIVINEAQVPVIIDADGLNILARWLDKQSNDLEKRLELVNDLLADGTILTPHLRELSRILGEEVSFITDNIIDTAGRCSYNSKLIHVIKDARTVVAHKNKKYINISGNNGMATGGSGDVLTGMIAAMIAQGMPSFEAACLAVYIHGLAGDEACKEKGPYSLMADDIVEAINKVLKN